MTFLPLKKFVTTLNLFRPNVIKFWTKFGNKFGCRLRLQPHLIYIYIYIFFFLLDVNFDKFTIGLHFFLISFILENFQ